MARKSKSAPSPEAAMIDQLVGEIRETLIIYRDQAVKGRRGQTDAHAKWIHAGIGMLANGADNFDSAMAAIEDQSARAALALIVRDVLFGGITLGAVADPLNSESDILARHQAAMKKTASKGGTKGGKSRNKTAAATWRDDAFAIAQAFVTKKQSIEQSPIVHAIQKAWPKNRKLVQERQLHNVVGGWIKLAR